MFTKSQYAPIFYVMAGTCLESIEPARYGPITTMRTWIDEFLIFIAVPSTSAKTCCLHRIHCKTYLSRTSNLRSQKGMIAISINRPFFAPHDTISFWIYIYFQLTIWRPLHTSALCFTFSALGLILVNEMKGHIKLHVWRVIICGENAILDFLNFDNSRTDFNLIRVIRKTTDFSVFLENVAVQFYNTFCHITRIEPIFTVYNALQIPPVRIKLLSIMLKDSG